MKGVEGDVEGPMQMVANDQGHLYIAWADNRDGEYGIYLVASTDHGRTWSKEVRLDVAKMKVSRASLPTLAADPSGHVYVAWQDTRHGGWDIYLNMSSDFGKTWRTDGIRLNTGSPGEAEARLPQDLPQRQREHCRRLAGRSWSQPEGRDLPHVVDRLREDMAQRGHPSRRPDI